MSKIEWTGLTWNPIVGCSLASTGCAKCYAIGEAWRKMFHPNEAVAAKFAGTVEKSKTGQLLWTGKVNFSEPALLAPLSRKKPTTWFVNSLSDLFHENVTIEQIDRIFAVMAMCPQHRFQVLTKRADRMRDYLSDPAWRGRVSDIVCGWPLDELGHGNEYIADWRLTAHAPLPNVWLGVSVENQAAANDRIPALLHTPAVIRFLSCEPLVGAVDLTCVDINGDAEMDAVNPRLWADEIENWRGTADEWEDDFADWFGRRPDQVSGTMHPTLDWVICGGESGSGARPMHPNWARSLRDQCAEAGVPFFFKQWGEHCPLHGGLPPIPRRHIGWMQDDGRVEYDVSEDRTLEMADQEHQADRTLYTMTVRVGKKAAGRLLDGGTHDAMPEAAA